MRSDRQVDTRGLLVVGLFFAAVGLLLMTIGGISVQRTLTFLDDAVAGSGIVVDFRISQGNNGELFHPIVEFTAIDGETYTFDSSTGSNPRPNNIGDSVDIFYLEEDPSDARIDSFFFKWGVAVILAPMGTLFLLVGLAVAFALPRKAQRDINERFGDDPNDAPPSYPQDEVKPYTSEPEDETPSYPQDEIRP